MNLTVKLQDLQTIVGLAATVTPTRSTLPSLGAVLLAYDDCVLTASATDLKSFARARCDAVGEQSGAFGVRADLLASFLGGCTTETVEVAVDKRAAFTCGTNRAMLSIIPLDQFQSHPDVEGNCLMVPARELHDAIARVAFAAGDEKDGYQERISVALDFGPTLDVVALNGAQFGAVRIERTGSGRYLVPLFLASLFRKVLDGHEGEVALTLSNNAVRIATDAWSLSGPLLNLEYPDWRKRLPFLSLNEGAALLGFTRSELIGAFQSCVPFGEAGFVRVHVKGNGGGTATVEIAGQDEAMSQINYSGPAFEFHIEGRKMIELLQSLLLDEVTLEFTNEKGVGIVVRENNFTGAIMPLRE